MMHVEEKAEALGVWPKDLARFCRTNGLAGFKIPQLILVQTVPLPLNSSGKVLKQQVKQQLLGQVTNSLPESRL